MQRSGDAGERTLAQLPPDSPLRRAAFAGAFAGAAEKLANTRIAAAEAAAAAATTHANGAAAR